MVTDHPVAVIGGRSLEARHIRAAHRPLETLRR